MKKTLIWLFLLMLCGTFPAYSLQEEARTVLEEIPVQHNGRMKPFLTFSQEIVRHVTGDENYKNQSSTETVWSWISHPEVFSQKALVPVDFRPLRKVFGLLLEDNRVSPEVLLNHEPFTAIVREASQKSKIKAALTREEKESQALYDKAAVFRELTNGNMPGWLPNPGNPREGWYNFQQMAEQNPAGISNHYEASVLAQFQDSLAAVVYAFRDGEGPSVAQAQTLGNSLEQVRVSQKIYLDKGILGKELLYNRLHPFGRAWKVLFFGILFALTGYGLSRGGKKRKRAAQVCDWLFYGAFFAAFAVQSFGFYLRCQVAGRPPVSNMYESVVWVAWAVAFFSILLFAAYRVKAILFTAACVTTFGLVLTDHFPAVLDPTISTLVPVLRSNLWLSVHVLTITLSYGAFALAWGVGHAVVFSYAYAPEKKVRNKNLAQLLYRSVQIGVILLATGTVLGGVWAHYSWGRFWGWDPKETWALIALLGYVAILHGRLTGWLKTFGLAYGCVAAFLLVIMAWYGVNFVLAAGLHSYGFGGGGAPYVLGVALLDLAVVSWAAKKYAAART